MPKARLLWVLSMAVACGAGSESGPFEQPSTTPPPPPGGVPLQGNVAMASSDDGYGTQSHAFSPGTITIARTGTVTWANSTGLLHNVTFMGTTGAPSNIPSFSTGAVSRSFSTAGSFGYQCTNHAGMTGQVVVR